MLQLVLLAVVAFVAYVAFKHISSQPGSVPKGTFTDKLNDAEVSRQADALAEAPTNDERRHTDERQSDLGDTAHRSLPRVDKHALSRTRGW